MVESGGPAVAHESWRLCKLALESHATLHAEQGREQWRLLLLTVLRETVKGADLDTSVDMEEIQAFRDNVLSHCDDSTAREVSAALADLSNAQTSTDSEVIKPSKSRHYIPDKTDLVTEAAVALKWHEARAHHRQRSLPCGIVTNGDYGSEPMLIDGPIHKRWHSQQAGRKALPLLVSSPTRSPSRWLLCHRHRDELNECSKICSYGVHH